MSVLLLAPEKDLHTQAVVKALDEIGARWIRWSYDELFSHSAITAALGKQVEVEITIGASSRFSLNEISSIWLRRIGSVTAPRLPERWMEKMVEWEAMRALGGLWRATNVLWVNDPARETECLYKTYQLSKAAGCNLLVPATIVTNEPQRAREFCDRFNNEVVYKLIDEGSWRFFPKHEGPRGLPTMPFVSTDVDHLEQVSLGLHLFQQKIDKSFDVRATVVGDKIFAARIESQEGEGKIDFRLDYSVPIKDYQLPDATKDACLSLMRALGLMYGAFDFAVDRQGRHFFLEVNPAGQYLWIEQALGFPISLQLAKLLASGTG